MNSKLLVVIVAFFVGYFFISLLLINTNKKGKTKNSNQTKSDEKWYEVLGIKESASALEIKIAYKKKMQQYHPNKVASLGEEFQSLAEEKVKKINNAYKEALKIKNRY